MELRGPSITLRYATADDAPALLELAGDPQVTQWFSWGPYADLAEPLAYVERLAGERERGQQLDLLIVDAEDRPIGVTGLSELSRRDRRAIVGTWLGRDYWGTGANLQSKALVGHLAFRVLGLERLGAYADLENGRSQRALERVGFEREGVLRAWHRHGELVRDVVVLSLLRPAWESSALARVVVEQRGAPPPGFVVGPAAGL